MSVDAFSTSHGKAMSLAIEKKSALLTVWVQYISSYHLTGTADELIQAVGSSVREAAGSLSLGLLRQTLFSLRGQIDLLLAWLYFKDHAVEWEHANLTADGFKMKREILLYIEAHTPKFGAKFGILKNIALRAEVDPYRLLSAHIHAQSGPVLPAIVNLKDMVKTVAQCEECTEAAFAVSEYLSDILLAIHLPNWHSLPTAIQVAAKARFKTVDQANAFFA